MKQHILNIAKDFSPYPGARYYTDGQFSGEEFFDKKLDSAFKDALDANSKLIIDLDNTEGYATSFLDEAFSRLSKKYSSQIVLQNIELISTEEPDLIEEVKDYIKEVNEVYS